MFLLIVSVAVVLVVSGLCSLTEASLYAVRIPYLKHLEAAGSAAGRVLLEFKRNMQQPIAGILILNTAANTAGASIAGAQAQQVFGEEAIFWFAAVFTFSVLFLAEIMPKVAGVAYNRIVARWVSLPLKGVVAALYPLVWLSERVTQVFHRGPTAIAPEEEVEQFAAMSAEEGSILPVEAELVQNVLRLNDVRARDILTPRSVVFKLPEGKLIKDLANQVDHLPYARIPVHADDDPDHWTGTVLRRDLLRCLASDKFETSVASLARPLHVVPETTKGHQLLSEFLRRRAHMFGVIDEYGDLLGVVTLEDVLESLIGEEIVDETDTAVDLRAEARRRGEERFGELRKSQSNPDGAPENEEKP